MWLVLIFIFGPVPITAAAVFAFYLYYRWRFRGTIVRIFEEKPLFIIPRGTPVEGAQCVDIPVDHGLQNPRHLHSALCRRTQGRHLFSASSSAPTAGPATLTAKNC